LLWIGLAEQENKQPYAGLIACIGSTSDLNMQMNGLKLVNNLIKSAPSEETRKEFFATLMKLGLHKVLQRQIHIENQNWKEQIITYQYARLDQYNKLRLESYDKNNSVHEALLMQLWKAVFPDQVSFFLQKHSFCIHRTINSQTTSNSNLTMIGIKKPCFSAVEGNGVSRN
jgi:hypothetical protein